MDEKKKKQKKVLIIVLVLGLVLLTIGGTYALFNYARQGEKINTLTTGTMYFVYDELPDEEDSNKISISNAFPVTDDKGMKQDKPGMFEFEVRAQTQGADINYEIYLTKNDSSTLPEKVVDTYLTTIGTKGGNVEDEELVVPSWNNEKKKENGAVLYQYLWDSHVPVLEEGQEGKALYQETIKDTKEEYSKIFRYRMWLDEGASDVNANGEWVYGGKSFTVYVNVYASNEELPEPTPPATNAIMQKWTYNTDVENLMMGGSPFPKTDFHTQEIAPSISNIKFINKIARPENTKEEWDISENEDGSVIAYMIPNEAETCQDIMGDGETIPCNDIVIASNGEAYGNPDSSFAFAYFTNLKTIDFTNFNASLIENTSVMFGGCQSLTLLDLSKWDTSSLKTISTIINFDGLNVYMGMFAGCSQLTSVGNLSSWNTSNISNMSTVFAGTQISDFSFLENWDTSSVTDMSYMFSNCSQLTTLDLSRWDVSSVTDMSRMFYCSQLTTLDLSNWTTSSVTDMSEMFYGCSNLIDLDLSGWDTSSVTDMSSMFSGCTSLNSLKLDNWNTSNVVKMGGPSNQHSSPSTGMFGDCSNLTELDLSSFDFSNVKEFNQMFEKTDLLTKIYVKDQTAKEWIITNADQLWNKSSPPNNLEDVVQVKIA